MSFIEYVPDDDLNGPPRSPHNVGDHEDERLDFDEIARRISADELADALDAKPGHGRGSFHCPDPDHEDSNPSFSIFRDDGRTVGICHSCGLTGSPVQLVAQVYGLDSQEAALLLAEEIGMEIPSENGGPPESEDTPNREEWEAKLQANPLGPYPDPAPDQHGDDNGSQVEPDYVYRNASADRVARKLRESGKQFRWERWTGAGWRPGLDGLDVPLYHLPLVRRAVEGGDPVWIWIVEGEKDVESAMSGYSVVATCNPEGAGSWPSRHTESLAGAERVNVVADNDLAGWKHAANVARELSEHVGSVQTYLPAVEEEHADLTDHLEAGHGLGDLRPVEVEELERKVRAAKLLEKASPERLRDLDARLFSAREVLEHGVPPEPPNNVPQLAWERRLTLVTAPKGGGKTTFLAAAAARFSRGDSFLGNETTGPGTVLWLTEETRGDPVDRHRDWGGDPDRLHVLEGVGRRPLEDLALAAALCEPDWLVVDTLSTLAQPLNLEVNDSAGWTGVIRQIREIVQAHGATATIAHHPTKKDSGQPRDSAAIEEQVDVSLVYRRKAGSKMANLDPVKARRLDLEALECEIRLTQDGFELVGEKDGGPSIKARVRSFIDRNGPVTKREVREGVTGDNGEIDAALRKLMDDGEVFDDPDESGRGWALRVRFGGRIGRG